MTAPLSRMRVGQGYERQERKGREKGIPYFNITIRNSFLTYNTDLILDNCISQNTDKAHLNG